MTALEMTDRVASALARADALMLAFDGVKLPDGQVNALTFLAGEVRDYLAGISTDLEASRAAARS